MSKVYVPPPQIYKSQQYIFTYSLNACSVVIFQKCITTYLLSVFISKRVKPFKEAQCCN